MYYTISEVAKIMNIPSSTLRYYDKEGLLPFVERTEAGYRRFQDADLEWLSLVECLKGIGMSIREIHAYMELRKQGDATLKERHAVFVAQEQSIRASIDALNTMLETIRYKKWIYHAAIEAENPRILQHPELADAPCPYKNACYNRILENKKQA